MSATVNRPSSLTSAQQKSLALFMRYNHSSSPTPLHAALCTPMDVAKLSTFHAQRYCCFVAHTNNPILLPTEFALIAHCPRHMDTYLYMGEPCHMPTATYVHAVMYIRVLHIQTQLHPQSTHIHSRPWNASSRTFAFVQNLRLQGVRGRDTSIP